MIYEKLLRPLLFSLDAETAHNLACAALPLMAVCIPSKHNPFLYTSPRLRTTFLSMPLNSPLGLAAGFDKNGKYVTALTKLGFSFLEIGSVQALPTLGNPRPRLFRLPQDQALINRLGLNGEGADVISRRLTDLACVIPVGINIAKTNDASIVGDAAIQDILYSFKKVSRLPIAYVTINVSCPNTEKGRLQEAGETTQVLEEVAKLNTRKLPILVKLSPDSPEDMLEIIVDSAIKNSVSGFVCGNTTIKRNMLTTPQTLVTRMGNGGISGCPLKSLAIELVRKVCRLKSPNQIVVGVGGIMSGQDIYDFLKAGATTVQAYTGFVYRGPAFCKQVCFELDELLKRDGVRVQELAGTRLK